ncbi:hypothetical protein CFN78_05315 [Amycolatopsis antarctica]|uniref:Uncharacterized protein n=1 Tax=Amycolatopsis antarctica TaxID=1854586 RepID=A0A263D7W6_9PSEU|nr:hypothetical protein [Amycolatopsis antarctica]OZM74533.1 hypothetical protein CFN78_05315 [Amycolatopsis antarctica]
MTGTHHQDTGRDGASLADEIRLLVELVVDRAAPWLDGVIAAGHGAERATGEQQEQSTHPGSGCGWCPLCALVALVRGERPEIAARVLDQAAQLIALLRAVLADRWEPGEGVHMPGYQPPPRPDPPRPSARPEDGPSAQASPSRVQHIAVRGRWDEPAGER